MAWFYLFIAAVFEVGWPLGFKLSAVTSHKLLWIAFAVIAMALSGVFLYIAQKDIPIGVAYAVWTGIGAACTFLIGVAFFNDSLSLMKVLGVALIIVGVTLLKVGH
ncbi:multidrug efflux SMR transporter [bacterium]|nr:multidrug efflux SMR transporter [bacterium]